MPITRRAGIALVSLLVLGASCDAQVAVVIGRVDGFTGPVRDLKIHIVTEDGSDVTALGPISVSAAPEEQFAPIPPKSLFYVDVMGCLGPTADQCDEEVEFIARGCSSWTTVAPEDPPRRIDVKVDRAVIGASSCPPTQVRAEDAAPGAQNVDPAMGDG